MSWHSAVFSGWRARCVGGVCDVSFASCSSASDDRFFIAVVDGIVKISRRRIFRNCTYRETPGAFGPCTAPRTSHSPSILRAGHSGLHGTVRCFSNCTWVDVIHCVSFRPRAASSHSFMNDDIILAFRAFCFYVVSSVSDCVIVLSECCYRCNDSGGGCEQVAVTAFGVLM